MENRTVVGQSNARQITRDYNSADSANDPTTPLLSVQHLGGGGAGAGAGGETGAAGEESADSINNAPGRGGRRRKWVICGAVSGGVFALLLTTVLLSYFIFLPQYIQRGIQSRSGEMQVQHALIRLGANPTTDKFFYLDSRMSLPNAPADVLVESSTGKVYYTGYTSELEPAVCPIGGRRASAAASSAANKCSNGNFRRRVGTISLPSFKADKDKVTEAWINGTFHVEDLGVLRDQLRAALNHRKVCWAIETDLTVRLRGFFSFIPFYGIRVNLAQHFCGAAGFVDSPPRITTFNVTAARPGAVLVETSTELTNPTNLEVTVPSMTLYIEAFGQPLASTTAAPFLIRQGLNTYRNMRTIFAQNDGNRAAIADFISTFVSGQVGHGIIFGNSSSTDVLVLSGLASSARVNVTAPGSKYPRIVNYARATWDLKRYLEGYIPLTLNVYNPLAVPLHIQSVLIDVYLKGKRIARADESFAPATPTQRPGPAAATTEGPPFPLPPLANNTSPEILAAVKDITRAEIEEVLGDAIFVSVNGTLTVVLDDGFETEIAYEQSHIPAKFEKLP